MEGVRMEGIPSLTFLDNLLETFHPTSPFKDAQGATPLKRRKFDPVLEFLSNIDYSMYLMKHHRFPMVCESLSFWKITMLSLR